MLPRFSLSTDAFLSDGKNEISGSRIAYDLRREVVTAGGTRAVRCACASRHPQKPGSAPVQRRP